MDRRPKVQAQQNISSEAKLFWLSLLRSKKNHEHFYSYIQAKWEKNFKLVSTIKESARKILDRTLTTNDMSSYNIVSREPVCKYNFNRMAYFLLDKFPVLLIFHKNVT